MKESCIWKKTIYNQGQMLSKLLHNLMLPCVRNRKVIFIHESGFQLTHCRNHGDTKVGPRPVLIVPKIKSTNLIRGCNKWSNWYLKAVQSNKYLIHCKVEEQHYFDTIVAVRIIQGNRSPTAEFNAPIHQKYN